MKILIIGGTRFIGPYVIQLLLKKGHDVTVFHREKTGSVLSGKVQHVYGDRKQLAEYARVFRNIKPDVVLDMIAYSETDAQTVLRVFSGLAERIIAVSSIDVYRAY